MRDSMVVLPSAIACDARRTVPSSVNRHRDGVAECPQHRPTMTDTLQDTQIATGLFPTDARVLEMADATGQSPRRPLGAPWAGGGAAARLPSRASSSMTGFLLAFVTTLSVAFGEASRQERWSVSAGFASVTGNGGCALGVWCEDGAYRVEMRYPDANRHHGKTGTRMVPTVDADSLLGSGKVARQAQPGGHGQWIA